MIATVLDPEGIMFLANLPRGSAEMELMNVVPIFYVYHYLERTDSWNLLGSEISTRVNMRRKLKEGKLLLLQNLCTSA